MEISPPRDDFADRADVVGGEEQPTIGNRDDGARPAAVDRNRIFTDHFAVRRHAADLVGKILGEPEISVRRHRDAAQRSVRGLHRPLGDTALRVDTPERVGLGLDEPDVAVGMHGHGARLAIRRRDFVFGDMTVHADPADLAGLVFAEPEFAVAHHQRKRAAVRREALRKFRHRAAGRDTADVTDVGFGKPHVSVRTRDDAVWPGADRRNGKFGDRARRGDPSDPVAGVLAEPQRPIGGRGDPDRPAVWRWRIEFDEAPIAGIHSADLGCPAFAEPKVPVRTEYDDVRLALRRRNRMQDYLNVSHRPSSLYCRRGEWRGYASHAADPSDLGPLPRGDVSYPRMVVARSNGNAEQPRGVGAENRVLLLLADFLGAADIFNRPLFRKRIVGGQHDMAGGD